MYGVDVSVDNFIDDEYIDLPYGLEVAREAWPLLWEDESPWDHGQRKAWLTLRADTLRAELSAKTVKVLTLTIEISTVVDRWPIYLEATFRPGDRSTATYDKIYCHGERETIELAVSPEDAKRIKSVKDLLDLSDKLRRK